MNANPTSLPPNCPLQQEADMYHQHELHKMHDGNADWQCTYCNKRFVSEKYLDRHLHNMHSHLVPENSTVCLASYSKMFGFRTTPENTATTRAPMNGMYAKIKKSFGAMEKCTAKEVEALKEQCDRLATSCFPGPVTEAKFNNLVCNNLKCVNGVLKGGLYKGDEADDVFVTRALRVFCVVIILCILAVQVFMTDSVYNKLRNQMKGKKADVDYLHKHGQSKRSYGWFLDTVLDACAQARGALQRSLKRGDKRQ